MMLQAKKMLKAKTIFTALYLSFASSVAFAWQALDDSSLSQTTAQDGLTIKLENFTPNAQIVWTDTNGINPADGSINPADYGLMGTSAPGSVVMGDGTTAGNFRISKGTTVITLDADAGVGNPFLNIGIKLPEDLTIQTGDVFVAAKDADNKLVNKTRTMRDMKVELGGLKLNIQLGNAPQDGMLRVYGTIDEGVRVSNIALIGASSGGDEYGIGINQMRISDAGDSSRLTFNGAKASISDKGILATPSPGKRVDVFMENFRLGNLSGSAAGLADIGLMGLNVGDISVLISGH